MNDWEELDAILQKHNYTFINDYGVMFNRVAPGFMFVDARWPGFKGEEHLMLVYLCNDSTEFFERLKIKTAQQLDQVKPELLLSLFPVGEVMVVCSADREESLEFQMDGKKLIANTGDSDMMHEVKKHLAMPEDFIEYTKQYFLILKDESIRMN